jgi:arabinan endo-1,5-alpha-L-arabinosidase
MGVRGVAMNLQTIAPASSSGSSLTYRNPVWHLYFADPFILRHEGGYYAYGTGATPREMDGRAFPLLRSDDLVNWEYLGGSLRPIPGATAYWAPEVVENRGIFYLYYSAALDGSHESHGLRVALADFPTGPFNDSGRLLLPDQGFTIDPHPFRDPETGQWYLFFATDYTNDEPHGTGLAVVPMNPDMASFSAAPTTVVRASQPWHVYERDRNYKGQTWRAWHTIEGAFVLFHDNRYWCLYSGGRWSGEGYGIGFAVADHPLGPWTDESSVHGPVVLKGTRDEVVGPGHNSVTVAPDGHTDLLVYHAWNKERSLRRMCIDPLVWSAQGPRCDGPTTDVRSLGSA